MAALKYKDSNGNYQPLVGLIVQNEVVQTTGTSTTAVMSQKASTDSFYTKAQVDAMRSPTYDATNKRYTFPANATFDYDSTNKRIILSQ